MADHEICESGRASLPVQLYTTLESGINVAPSISIATGKFGKKNKRSLIHTLYLYYTKIGSMKSRIRPWPLEKSQEINKRRGTFITDSRVCYYAKDRQL